MIAFVVYAAVAAILFPFAIKFALRFMDENDLLFHDGMDTAGGIFFGFMLAVLWPVMVLCIVGFKISKLIGNKEEDK